MPETAVVEPVEENFADAFERLAELGDKKPPNDAAATPVAEVAPVPAPVEGEPAPPVVEGEPAPNADATPALAPAEGEPAPAAKEPVATDDDMLQRFARIMKESGLAAPTPAPQPTPAPATEQQPELFSQEEKTFISTYQKDWPDVAKAEALIRRAEYQDVVSYVFNEVSKQLTPLIQTVGTLSERTHLNDLHEQVADYDDIREKVIEWAGTQPAYLHPAYAHVIQRGTPSEVADLIARYRQAIGAQAPAAQAAQVPTAKKQPEMSSAAKQAVAALAPVSSKRSAVIQGNDPNDFNAAFEQFAEKADTEKF